MLVLFFKVFHFLWNTCTRKLRAALEKDFLFSPYRDTTKAVEILSDFAEALGDNARPKRDADRGVT